MAEREIVVEGERWRVTPMPQESQRRHSGGDWHLVRVRFDPVSEPGRTPRATWLRCEHDIPAKDVLSQHEDEPLMDAFLVAEELQI